MSMFNLQRSDALFFNITRQAIFSGLCIFNPGGGAGGASILDLHSGALSKEKLFINLYKTNPGLFNERDFDLYRFVFFIPFYVFPPFLLDVIASPSTYPGQ